MIRQTTQTVDSNRDGMIHDRDLDAVFRESSLPRDVGREARAVFWVGGRRSEVVFAEEGSVSCWPSPDILRHRFGGTSRWSGRKWVSVLRVKPRGVFVEMARGDSRGGTDSIGSRDIVSLEDQDEASLDCFEEHRFFSMGEGPDSRIGHPALSISFGCSRPRSQGVGSNCLGEFLAINLFEWDQAQEALRGGRQRSPGWKR